MKLKEADRNERGQFAQSWETSDRISQLARTFVELGGLLLQ